MQPIHCVAEKYAIGKAPINWMEKKVTENEGFPRFFQLRRNSTPEDRYDLQLLESTTKGTRPQAPFSMARIG